MILYMYTALGQGLTTPWGWNFDVNRNILSLRSFVASFKKISLKSDFIQLFSWFYTCIYSPGTGADSPQGTKFWFPQKYLVTTFICCKFKRKHLWKMILYIFFSWYSPRAGVHSPRGQNYDVNRKALSLYPFVSSFKSLWSLILYIFFMI